MREAAGPGAWRGRATVRGLVLLVAVALSIPAPVHPDAHAQEHEPPRVRLLVTELSGVLGPGTVEPPEDDALDPDDEADPPTDLELRAVLENRGEHAVQTLRFVVEVHPAAPSRAALRQALDEGPITEPLLIDDVSVSDDALPGGAFTGIERAYEQERIAWAEDGGVHPVRISVVRGTEILDTVTTAVVWLAEPPATPVSTVFVWPVDERPWRSIGGTYRTDVDRSIRTAGRLDDLVRVLERASSPPVVLAVAPHLLEDLRDRADGFTAIDETQPGRQQPRLVEPEAAEARLANATLRRLRELADDLPHPPVVGTYAAADLSLLHATGDQATRELASDAAGAARVRVQRELGRLPSGSAHLLSGGVAPPILDLLPVDQLLVPYAATADPPVVEEPDLGPPIRSLRSPAGRSLTAMVADPYLSELVAAPSGRHGPVVPAQRMLAETAIIHLEGPTAGRTVLILPDGSWEPDVQTLERTLAGLADAPWIDLTDPATAFATGRRGVEPLELVTPGALDGREQLASEITTAVAELAAARAMLPEETTTIAGRDPEELQDALLRASSRWYADADPEALQLATDVRATIEALFGEITIAETGVTLTADVGQVPVTLQRTVGEAVAVRVEVASPGGLVWPEGRHSEVLLLQEDGSTTVAFETEARTTGTIPVSVRVTDPSGTHELARTTVTVRSTAISGPALTGISALVVVLLLLGALRRRRPEPTLAVVEDRARPSEAPYSR